MPKKKDKDNGPLLSPVRNYADPDTCNSVPLGLRFRRDHLQRILLRKDISPESRALDTNNLERLEEHIRHMEFQE